MWWRLANEEIKPAELLRHKETEHPVSKDKPLEFFERKNREYEAQKESLTAAQVLLSARTVTGWIEEIVKDIWR